jgi:asparagine synthase (glutamine-hydrolysing)
MARETYAQLMCVHPLSFALFCQAPWHHFGLLALEETQLSLRSPYLDNDLIRTIYRAPTSHRAKNHITLRLLADGDVSLDRIRTDLGFADGLAAFPGVSRHLLNFTFKAEYAYDCGMPQWLARIDHLFSPLHLERFFLGRHKFSHFRIWYRDALAEYVQQMLLDPRTLSRPYLQRNAVETIVQGHLHGGRNYTAEIHQLLTLELIHRLFLDSTLETPRHETLSEAFAGTP